VAERGTPRRVGVEEWAFESFQVRVNLTHEGLKVGATVVARDVQYTSHHTRSIPLAEGQTGKEMEHEAARESAQGRLRLLATVDGCVVEDEVEATPPPARAPGR